MSEALLVPKLLSIGGLFGDEHVSYEIPIYQRNYAWGVPEIEQLIEDVWVAASSSDPNDYFLGNLVVAQKPAAKDINRVTYEVIDGQQRLTTLFMILTFLGHKPKAQLTYRSRQTATQALIGLATATDDEGSGIHTGYATIRSRLERGGSHAEIDRDRFVGFLTRAVNVVRVTLPPNTDLNKYFEVMNTRGQQLSQVDIVKARLMGYLGAGQAEVDSTDVDLARRTFAWVWDACSNMDGYVQMSLTRDEPELRTAIFGDRWDGLVATSFDELSALQARKVTSGAGVGRHDDLALEEALALYARAPEPTYDEDGGSERFESPIRFPSLLLHTLKVMSGQAVDDIDDSSGQLDDSKLIKLFDKAFSNASETDRAARAKAFLESLLRCRFVLDNYVLKREFTSKQTEDGAWSLKRLQMSDRRQTSFPNAFDVKNDVYDGDPLDDLTFELRQLQSMLRVTYTSPRSMHWITAVLRLDLVNRPRREAGADIRETLRHYARAKVLAAFPLDVQPTGFKIERIVFTYLDFLLDQAADRRTGAPLTFAFRNSVEHFFPQEPRRDQLGSDAMPQDAPELNMLGNLALVSVGTNSKFSNDVPHIKADLPALVAQSAKLQLMAGIATGLRRDGRYWDAAAIQSHHNEMVTLLRQDLMASDLA